MNGELLALFFAAVRFLEEYGPLLAEAEAGRKLLREMVQFVRSMQDIEGITPEQRERALRILELDPEDVTL